MLESRLREWLEAVGWIDTIALGLCLWFLIRGLVKGFLWQLAGLVTLIGGMWFSQSMAPRLAPVLTRMFPSMTPESNLDIVIAYFVIFMGFMMLVLVVARWTHLLIRELQLTAYDRLLGGVFGLAKATLIIIVALSASTLIEEPSIHRAVAETYAGRMAGYAVEKGGDLFPDSLRARVREIRDQLRSIAPRAVHSPDAAGALSPTPALEHGHRDSESAPSRSAQLKDG